MQRHWSALYLSDLPNSSGKLVPKTAKSRINMLHSGSGKNVCLGPKVGELLSLMRSGWTNQCFCYSGKLPKNVSRVAFTFAVNDLQTLNVGS